jgi:hypothetical protein
VVTLRPERTEHGFTGWLALFALGYALFHHVGSLPSELGTIGSTRWADWIDLITPYVVTGAAAATLHGAGARRGTWVAFWFGAVLYVQGHGIHLAANSIGNVVRGQDVVHLWDETVGHYLWYTGFAILVAVLAVTLADRRPRGGLAAHLLAAAVGFTHFTNSVGGQAAYLGIGTAVAFASWGLQARDRMGRYLLTSYGLSLLLFAAYGFWQGGFPDFSDVDWP